MRESIALQELLRPALPEVFGCKDYAEEERLLVRVDRILRASGVEDLFLELSLGRFDARVAEMEAAGQRAQKGPRAVERYLEQSRRALRCTVLGKLSGNDYRQQSKELAMSPLYRWFCRLEDFEVVRVPGKSALQGYAHWLSAGEMERVLGALAAAVADGDRAREIGLAAELEMGVAWVDATCLKANIHFPADWALLRDGVRTLVKSILTVRRHGLRNRIPEPGSFLREINAMAMGMAGARRKPDGRRERKGLLRRMKRVCKLVGEHGRRYRDLLDERWRETDLTRKEAAVILRRMDNVLAKLPAARRQAHERIIGGRKVANADKILSLYEEDARVIVRGKAGAEVEFGNSLFLAENTDGFILDHELRREQSPGDTKWLLERLPAIQEAAGGELVGVVGDRGFDSAAARRQLTADDCFNGLCPRNPKELARRMAEDEIFVGAMRRRAQTEGRIGILKNVFLQGTPRAKGFANRQMQVAWAVLAHNLWVVTRLPWAEESEKLLAA